MSKKSKAKTIFLKELSARMGELYHDKKFRSYSHVADIAREKGFEIQGVNVSKYLYGTEPGAYGLAAMAAAFGVTTDYLVSGKESANSGEDIKKALELLEKLRINADSISESKLNSISKRLMGLPEELRAAVETFVEQLEVLSKKNK